MPFRIGILDLTAALVVLVVMMLPDRSLNVASAYRADPDQQRAIALHQAQLAADPSDMEAAANLSDLLIESKQTDWAVQAAASAAQRDREDSWRALLAVSSAYAERRNVPRAHEYGEKALKRCIEVGSEHCPSYQRTRMSLYFQQLQAGLESGIDPKLDPQGYIDAVVKGSGTRIIQFRGATPRDVEDKSDGEDTSDGDSKP